MKTRLWHVAALSLVGFYLMMPPIGRKGDGRIDIKGDAPISQWTVVKAFDSASDCETWRDAEAKLVVENMYKAADETQPRVQSDAKPDTEQLLRENPGMEMPYVITTLTQCIASDDPRLVNDPLWRWNP